MDAVPKQKKTRRKKEQSKKLSKNTAVRFDEKTTARIEKYKNVRGGDTSKLIRDAVNEKLDRELPENK